MVVNLIVIIIIVVVVVVGGGTKSKACHVTHYLEHLQLQPH